MNMAPTDLGRAVLFNLFYPQIRAAANLAFNEFYLSDQYSQIEKIAGKEKALETFLAFHIEKYMIDQFKKHPVKIIFFPWTVLENPEFYL